MSVKYYREPNGDYLAAYYDGLSETSVMVRAAAIAGDATSVCTTGATLAFLRDCVKVRKAEVPARWLAGIDPGVPK